jgi:uncharacterized protein
MNADQTMIALKEMAPLLAQRGVTGLSIFGSRSAGSARPESDLDVLIDYDPASRFSLLDLLAVARLIEDHIGMKADVVTRTGLHPVLKDAIEKSALRVY